MHGYRKLNQRLTFLKTLVMFISMVWMWLKQPRVKIGFVLDQERDESNDTTIRSSEAPVRRRAINK